MTFKLFYLVFQFLFTVFSIFFDATNSNAQRVNKTQKLIATKIKLEGNIIFNDRSLAKSIDLGSGLEMNQVMRELMIAEMEGYYSSNGFYMIKTNFPRIKARNRTLTLFIDERDEIKEGQTEKERAEQTVDLLISYRNMQISDLNRQKAIKKLIREYRNQRIIKAKLERKRLEKQKANVKATFAKQANNSKTTLINSELSKLKKILISSKSETNFVPLEQDYKKAQTAIDRLIEKRRFKISPKIRQQVIAKLINGYREKRLDQVTGVKILESRIQRSDFNPRLSNIKTPNYHKIYKMRQRMKTIKAGQNFRNTTKSFEK